MMDCCKNLVVMDVVKPFSIKLGSRKNTAYLYIYLILLLHVDHGYSRYTSELFETDFLNCYNC